MSVFTSYPFYTIPSGDCGNFGSLVRFIDDWDKHFSSTTNNNSRTCQPRQSRRNHHNTPTFTPRFDVRETENNYELHGELPGIKKEDINIDFSDAQTIVIRGNVERTYTEGTAPAGLLDADTEMSGAITEKATDDSSETRSNKSYQATVEDDFEEVEGSTTAPKSPVVEKSAPVEKVAKPEVPAQKKSSSKYWVYERSVGSFSRSFVFSDLVDHENVSASLDNGILTVIVPKAKKPEPRRIVVF